MPPRSVLLAALLTAALPRPGLAEGPESAPGALFVPAGPGHPIDPPAVRPPDGSVAAPVPASALQAGGIAEAPAEAAEGEEASHAEPAAPPPALSASQREALRFQMKSYLRQVHERIGAAWAAPLAPDRAPRREALVTVVIARDGRVVEARVDRTSRDAGFDQSALRALGRPFLFPPLPPYYQTDVLEVGLRFADPARPRRR